MIDYALLCQTIADWRSGRRPTFPPSATPTLPGGAGYGAAQDGSQDGAMEEVDSDLIVVDEYGEAAAPEGYVSPDRTPRTPSEVDSTHVYNHEYRDDDE